ARGPGRRSAAGRRDRHGLVGHWGPRGWARHGRRLLGEEPPRTDRVCSRDDVAPFGWGRRLRRGEPAPPPSRIRPRLPRLGGRYRGHAPVVAAGRVRTAIPSADAGGSLLVGEQGHRLEARVSRGWADGRSARLSMAGRGVLVS